jgi:CHAD domain-containing protein
MSGSRSQGKPADVNGCSVLIEALEVRHRNFAVELVRVRRRPSEPGVHDLRVSIRRLITVIDIVAGIVPEPGMQKRRKLLRKFLKSFNALRDLHIQRIALRKLCTAFPPAGSYLRDMQVRERVLLRSTGRSARTFETDGLREAIAEAEDGLLNITINRACVSATETMVMGILGGAFSRVVSKRQMLNGADPATIHRMRVAFKKFRYALEVLAPLLPWVNDDFRSKLNLYQTLMGNIQDSVVLLDGISAYEAKRPITGRMALIAVREHLLRRRSEQIDDFLANVDDLYSFWRSDPACRSSASPSSLAGFGKRMMTSSKHSRFRTHAKRGV